MNRKKKERKSLGVVFPNVNKENPKSYDLKGSVTVEGKKYRIAYHSACSMQHGQKVHNQPMELLSRTNNEIMEIPNGHLCCGSAGTYNILQTEIAKKLLKDKVNNIESLNPQIISTGNIGCITQISNGTNIPILHTIELLDWYTGGSKPKILERVQFIKKILVTRKLLPSNKDRVVKLFNEKLNLNDELNSQNNAMANLAIDNLEEFFKVGICNDRVN